MRRIPETTIKEIIEANPIEDIVGQYVELHHDGRNLKGLCPFHKEKTPSFKIHPQKQLYHCFGCGESGNVLSFVMAIERLDFISAVKMLAERAGIQLQAEDGMSASLIDQARKANEYACDFYQRQLKESDFGRKVATYLENRGFNHEMQSLFRLGAALESWDALHSFLRRKGIGSEAMKIAGLVAERKNGRGYYDCFRGRLLFPIINQRGKVIGFGGRSLSDDGPKYLNTSETQFFHKGRVLFGLHLAADIFRSTRQAIIVEGYTDVIMAVQSGFEGVVACLGTAFTHSNAQALKHFVDKVILLYDGDEAGSKAAERALGPLLSQGLDVRIAMLPDGLDPCDFLRKRGPEQFSQIIKRAEEGVLFLVKRARSKGGENSPAAVREAIMRTLNPLNDVTDPLIRQIIIKKVASEFGVPESVLFKVCPKPVIPHADKEVAKRPQPVYPGPEETLLAALIAEPELQKQLSLPETLEDPILEEIRQSIINLSREADFISTIQARFSGTDAGKKLVEILCHIEDLKYIIKNIDWNRIASDSLDSIWRKKTKKKENLLREQMEATRLTGNKDEYRLLLSQYQELLRKSKSNSLENKFLKKSITSG